MDFDIFMQNFPEDPSTKAPMNSGYFEEDHRLFKAIRDMLVYLSLEKQITINIIVDGVVPKTRREMMENGSSKPSLRQRRGLTETLRVMAEVKVQS